MHERPGARAPAPWQAARASAWAGSARALAHGQAARARALAHGQAARARALAHGQPARARALAHGQAARARVLARGQPARALAHGQAARARAHQRPGRQRARARTRALAGMRARAHPRPGRHRARAHPRPGRHARARAPAPWQAACARAPAPLRARQRAPLCARLKKFKPPTSILNIFLALKPFLRLWPTKPQSEDNSLALPTWLSRGVERLTPPGPWDFLEALWGVWFARPKTNRLTPPGPWDFLEALWGVWFARPKTNVDVGLWPTKPQSEDNSLALPTWLSRGVERLTPPGPWDFLEALWGVWFARPKTNGCVLAGHILKTKHWFSDAIFIMGTAYEIHRAVAKSTVLCLTSFFMNVESWPLLGQRLTPPGPWDFLEALWGVWFARPKTNGCVLAGHILKTKHWFSDAIFIMGTAYEIHRAVAKSTVLCLTSFFMNVESWPLLGQRLTPPGPWDFLEALWGVWFARPKTNGCVLAGHILKTKHWFSDAIFIMGTAYEIHRAVAKSTVLCLTSFFMNVESWPLLGQRLTPPGPWDFLEALWGVWFARPKTNRLTPPGPWDFLEALWGVWFARPKTNVFPFACMPLALWGVVGLLVLILANGMAYECYSLFDGIYYSDNRSNSRANTCNKPRLLEGMHLLDKRSTQALPVALMIHDNSSDRTAFVPATHHSNFCPINFRCWTLGWVDRSASGVHRLARPFCRRCAPGLNWPGRASGAVTLKKLECSKQAYALDTLAWDNTTGF
ncbi:hypothetical protein VNO80_34498 [Phaseolus coccineus]|uniref:Uncharacterized protein n=4 Tax=Phaseoleae TaxID=163735 RepID=A0AAN9KWY5_PHACN